MTLRAPWRSFGLIGLAVALAALWPLSAYAASPLALPVALIAAAIAALVIAQPQYGVALAAVIAPIADIHIGGHHPLTDVLLAMVAALVVYGILLGPPARGGAARGGCGGAPVPGRGHRRRSAGA